MAMEPRHRHRDYSTAAAAYGDGNTAIASGERLRRYRLGDANTAVCPAPERRHERRE